MSRMVLVASAALLLAAFSAVEAQTLTQRNVSAAQAMAIIKGAMEECSDSSISITVVDREGLVRLQVRANDANPHNLELSRRKAYTARTFRMPSAEWAKRTEPGQELFGQRMLPDVIPLGGGVPIVASGGEVIGAVGISGANGGQPREEACSRAGIARIADQIS